MRALAKRLDYDASNLTNVVDRLEARGLLQRMPAPADRRVKWSPSPARVVAYGRNSGAGSPHRVGLQKPVLITPPPSRTRG